jgi:hypothetical protein
MKQLVNPEHPGGAMAQHDVFIVNVGGEYRVRPAVAAVEKTLKIRNVTTETAVLIFPAGTIAEGDLQTMQPGDKKKFTIGANAKDSIGYTVAVAKNGVLIPAKGESEPVIIIDP